MITSLRVARSAIAFAVTLTAGACAVDAPVDRPTLDIAVAPLTLPGVSKVCYDLRVTNGPGGSGAVVWAKGTPGLSGPAGDSAAICSDTYGNLGGGDITYIATCDADGQEDGDLDGERTNSVTLWFDGLYDAVGAYLDPAGAQGWQNPCPAPQGCTLDVLCRENGDTRVDFDLTVMRDASQGFFDVAVSFEDIFCSAKLDTCYAGGAPGPSDDAHIELLYGTDTTRDWTGVFGFACTAGTDADATTLLYSKVEVTCGSDVFTLDPRADAGNASVTVGTKTLHYGVYRGTEALDCGTGPGSCGKVYRNLAVSLDDLASFGGTCTLALSATANDDNAGFDAGLPTATGATYPYIDVSATLTSAGAASCQEHALNAPASVVRTAYKGNVIGVAAPTVMCSQYAGGPSNGAATGGEGCVVPHGTVLAGQGTGLGYNYGWNFEPGGVLDGFVAAVEADSNFGPSGVVAEDVTVTALQSLEPADLDGVTIFASTWWADSSSGPYVEMIIDWFLAGGDLMLFQDDTAVDNIGAALGIATVGSPSGFKTNGGAPLFAGPFGIAVDVRQEGNIGFLNGAAVTSHGGTIAGTTERGEVTVALWPAGAYAPGAGRLLIVADIDMLTDGVATYTPLNDNGRFALNAVAFMLGH